MGVLGKSVAGRGNSQNKGPEAGPCLASLKNSRKTSGLEEVLREGSAGLSIIYTRIHFTALLCVHCIDILYVNIVPTGLAALKGKSCFCFLLSVLVGSAVPQTWQMLGNSSLNEYFPSSFSHTSLCIVQQVCVEFLLHRLHMDPPFLFLSSQGLSKIFEGHLGGTVD